MGLVYTYIYIVFSWLGGEVGDDFIVYLNI